jgi:NADH-quinone oxidoreductase subunit I
MESILKSMWQTLKNIFRRSVTVLYPYDKIVVPETSRGMIVLKIDPDSHELLCTGCGECKRVCPTGVIDVLSVNDGEKQRASIFKLDILNCVFCGLCVDVCPYSAIEMTYKYELTASHADYLQYELEELVEYGKQKPREFWA